MSLFVLIFSILVSIATFAAEPEQHVTVSGAVYSFEPNAPAAMQPAYRDVTGLVWGDSQRIDLAHPKFFSWKDAGVYCASIDWNGKVARLPTVEEVIRLRQSMTLTPNLQAMSELKERQWSEERGLDYRKPALPHLWMLYTDFLWTSSQAPTCPVLNACPFVFHYESYSNGASWSSGMIHSQLVDVSSDANYDLGAVRCVIE